MRYLSDESKEVQDDFWRRHRESRKEAIKGEEMKRRIRWWVYNQAFLLVGKTRVWPKLGQMLW